MSEFSYIENPNFMYDIYEVIHMTKEQMHLYMMSKKGTQHDFKLEWDADRYLLEGKMYAYIGQDNKNRPIITLKGDPQWNNDYRAKYSYIVPGYYMNKQHWISIYLDANADDDVIKECIDRAYEVLLSSFSKAKREQIINS